MQIAAGATGITCAKLGEAEVMAAGGFDDILIANEIIGEQKFKRLIALAGKARICIAVDSVFGAQSLNAALAQANQTLEVVIEINCGQNRSGVLPGEEALRLAKEITQLKKLKLRGLMTHGGHAYNENTRDGIERIGREEGRVMVETAELLRSKGIPVATVSVGSTPAAQYCGSVPGVTEIRPGTYVFYDLTQVDLFALPIRRLRAFGAGDGHQPPNEKSRGGGRRQKSADLRPAWQNWQRTCLDRSGRRLRLDS